MKKCHNANLRNNISCYESIFSNLFYQALDGDKIGNQIKFFEKNKSTSCQILQEAVIINMFKNKQDIITFKFQSSQK